MLHRRHAPLFAGFAAITVALAVPAGPVDAQVPGAAPPAVAAPAAVPGAAPAAVPAADPFTVSGVKVDVSAANANAARDQAIRDAQVKAWAELYKRLVPSATTVPRVSDIELARLVQGFEIDDEKVSATRYVGSITVRFRPNSVRETLAGGGQQYVEPPARPYVILPVTVVDGRPVLWEDRTDWREAWEGRQTGASLVPLVVPDGELADISAIGVNEALSGDQEALARIAQRYNAGGVVVAKTDLPAGGLDLGRPLAVEVTHYTPDGTRDQQTVNVKADMADRAGDFLTRATTFVSAAIDESYRRDNTVASGPEQSTLVRVPLASLNDWVETRKRLGMVNAVTRTDVLSISRYEALVTLTHRGDVERLRQALARRDLGLARTGAVAAPVPVPAPGQPIQGQPLPPVAPTPEWQLQVLTKGAGASMAQPAAVSPAPVSATAPSSFSPAATPPSAYPSVTPAPVGAPQAAPGAPPRILGTLPAGTARP
ncbi:DUF2066 domain-containing protein [Azospirillum formosense]|uniref:DUF2066 domain-containing protein n=1 Tax=Azospirillum formosense TaxID=861533 RepID=A0ABX2KR16_9PROT|nr:DUF2066 domain-containing protein [Azospirillum formosense]MBY3755191.1 DUF2066 domain-containing protein [Azospirillum formosense]NUB18154.1 DUF2066 domain-containing protein [Azospirillum formosense]